MKATRGFALAAAVLLLAALMVGYARMGAVPAGPARSERPVAAPPSHGPARARAPRGSSGPSEPRRPTHAEQLEQRELYAHVSLLTCLVEGVGDAEAQFETSDALVAGVEGAVRAFTRTRVSIRAGAVELFVYAPDGVGELMVPGVGAATVEWSDLADGAGGACSARLSPSDGVTITGRVVGSDGGGPWSLTMCDRVVAVDALGRFVGPAAPGCTATARWSRGGWSVSSAPALVPAGATGEVFAVDGSGQDLALMDGTAARLLARRHLDGIEVVGDPSGRWGRGDVIESASGVACADLGCLDALEAALRAGAWGAIVVRGRSSP